MGINLLMIHIEYRHAYTINSRVNEEVIMIIRGYKTFFVLSSTKHEILTAHNYQNSQYQWIFSDLNHQSHSFILLINVKMPTIVGILTFMSRMNSSSVKLSMKRVL